jgi:hypothetical protein
MKFPGCVVIINANETEDFEFEPRQGVRLYIAVHPCDLIHIVIVCI